ncbi:unnamed protein product, partial [Amoebophrya sp. A25]
GQTSQRHQSRSPSSASLETVTLSCSERQEVKRFHVFRHAGFDMKNHTSKKRQHLSTSEIVLAFPEASAGATGEQNVKTFKLYNFLPICNSDFPFVANLDLLLTASRTDIHQDEDWNK